MGWSVLGAVWFIWVKPRKVIAHDKQVELRFISQGGIPLGFRSDDSCGFSLYDDDTNRAVAGVYVGGIGDSNFMRFTPYHDDPKVKGDPAIPDTGPKNLRPQAMMWTTSDPWPDRV